MQNLFEMLGYSGQRTYPPHNRNILFAAIKLDLVDAFGVVDIKQLISVFENDKSVLTPNEKKFLINRISNAFVNIKEKNKVYQWNHGE